MWFIKCKLTNDPREWWVARNEKGGYRGMTNALFAEAFGPVDIEKARRVTEITQGVHSVELVECSTRKIIPENMLKVLNLA